MTTTYRTSNPPFWTGVGRPLTFTETDTNWYDKETRLDTLEAEIASHNAGIDYFSVTGDQFYVHLTDHTTLGPYQLPTIAWHFRTDGSPTGTWLPSTLYNAMDVFQENGSLYQVNLTHTSALTFDPHATDGLGHNLYTLLLTMPDVLPLGGTTGQALVKNSNSDFDVKWDTPDLSKLYDVALTSPHNTGQLLTWNGTHWTNENAAAQALSGLSDVALLSPHSTNQHLVWNGTHWQNETITPAMLRFSVSALGVTGTVSLDPTLADVFTVTPTGAITLNAASQVAGARINIVVTTSGTSSYNITFNTGFKSTGVLATGTVSGKVFTISFACDGTNFNEVSRTTAM